MQKQKIKTKKGYEIAITIFEPIETPKGIVLISPATGVKQSYYLYPKNLNFTKIGHFGFFKEKMKNTIWKIIFTLVMVRKKENRVVCNKAKLLIDKQYL